MKYWILLLVTFSSLFAQDYEAGFMALKAKLNTPDKVQHYLTRYISYRFVYNRTPYQPAYKTYLCGYAGCTDTAQFAYEVLSEHGFECRVYEVWNSDRGHSFTVVRNEDGTWRNMSVYRPRKYRFESIEAIAFQQYGDLTGYKRVK